MCFVLYVATTRPLAEREWVRDSPNLSVQPLTAHDSAVKAHLMNPEVQFVGSTSGCGCDFPHVLFQNGDWPFSEEQIEPQQAASDRVNREGLVNVVQSTGDCMVELYGVWSGDYGNPPEAYESISVEAILNPEFRLRERVCYRVRTTIDDSAIVSPTSATKNS